MARTATRPRTRPAAHNSPRRRALRVGRPRPPESTPSRWTALVLATVGRQCSTADLALRDERAGRRILDQRAVVALVPRGGEHDRRRRVARGEALGDLEAVAV